MPISMTRKEYELKYGFAPVLQPISILANEKPAPRRMTRAEYEAEFGTSEKPKEGFFTKVGDAINEVNPFYQIPKMAIEGAAKLGTGLGEILDSKNARDVIKPTVSATAGGVQTVLAVPFGLFESVTNLPGLKQVKNFLLNPEPDSGSFPAWVGNKAGEWKVLQDFVAKHPDSPEVVGDIATIALGLIGGKEATKPEFKTEILKVTNKVVDPIANKIEIIKANAQAKAKASETTHNTEVSQEIANIIETIELGNKKTRTANEYSKDANASRLRIAEADVLPGSVDTTGTINSKIAVDEYFKKTLEGKEAVVRDNLAYLGEKVTLKQIESDLTTEIFRTGLEGADLVTAINKIQGEIEGIKLRTKSSNVPLEIVHDAKINTTKNIDYNTPPEIKTYRKAVARAYKKIVEDNSSFNVTEVNAELAKYYEDITRLENLHGRKVEGGRLSKYSAKLAGNIGGAVLGAPFGILGMGVSTIAGGEIASFVRGKQMSRTFGERRGLETPKNVILEQARLSAPDKVIKAVKGIKKTPEITQIEKDIKKNVAQQEKAIKAKDFTLVAKLKEIYTILVEKLKQLIQRIKDTPNKEGGFVRNPFSSPSTSGKAPKSARTKLPVSSSKSSTLTKKSQGYKETGNLTTKILKDLEGRTTVSRQYILDATNRGELKQVERDLTREVLSTMKGDTINVKEFADKVKAELLPLKRVSARETQKSVTESVNVTNRGPRYENVSLPDELRGNVKNYDEYIYNSPIKTSAGGIHFSGKEKNYFGHTRVEEMADGKTVRVIEVQSDLYQKGGLEREIFAAPETGKMKIAGKEIDGKKLEESDRNRVKKLQQYNDPTAHFRMIREEIKQAAKDGKTKLQFPTGDSAMKIEGLGTGDRWYNTYDNELGGGIRLETNQLKIGKEVVNGTQGSEKWIITDVLGDGKFKAIPKDVLERAYPDQTIPAAVKSLKNEVVLDNGNIEEFDISGKVDKNNPIYKFYEKDVSNYLKKFGGKRITDKQGVEWTEVPIKKSMGDEPTEAFGMKHKESNLA